MEKKYTPGPWSLDHTPRGMLIRSEQGPVALVQWGYMRGGKSALADETWANANLMAAAPELLAALELVLNDVESYGLAHPDGGRFECEHVTNARAVIAKAVRHA